MNWDCRGLVRRIHERADASGDEVSRELYGRKSIRSGEEGSSVLFTEGPWDMERDKCALADDGDL